MVELDFSLYLSDGAPVESGLFAESIQGMDRLLRDSSGALLKMLGVAEPPKKVHTSVAVDEVRKGSRLEDFVFRVFAGSEAEANLLADRIRAFMKEHPKAVASVLIAAILAWTATKAISIYAEAKSRQPAIEARDSVVVQVGRDLNADPQAVREILAAIPDRSGTSKAAAQVVAPAKLRPGTELRLGGRDGIEIPPAIVAPMPLPDQIREEPETREEMHAGVRVDFAAMDRDRQRSGWAVVLPAEIPGGGSRLPAKLSEMVNPTKLMYAGRDATVDLRVVRDAEGRPKTVVIEALHEPGGKQP